MKFLTIDEKNIDTQHICCAIGVDKVNIARADGKKKWLKDRFAEGLVFKRLDDRGKMFVEYMPVETVWKPIVGKDYLVINCLWVSGKFKGTGIGGELLDQCISDAKAQGKAGVCVVTSHKKRGFLTDKKFFTNHGFEVVDKGSPYFELLALTLDKTVALPQFTENAKKGIYNTDKDFAFIYSDQCTFMNEYSRIMSAVAEERGFSTEVIKLESSKQAKEISSPFGSFGVYFKGKLVNHELMPEKKFNKFIDRLVDY